MLKYPLNKEIGIITENNSCCIGTITFAGIDALTIKDLKQRIFYPDGEFIDIYMSDVAVLDRDKIIGYFNIAYEKPKKEKFKVVQNTQKEIPEDWYHDIIDYIIDRNSDGEVIDKTINKSDKVVTLYFSNSNDTNRFHESFVKQFQKHINRYIKNKKNEDPVRYNRDLVLSTTMEDKCLKIAY